MHLRVEITIWILRATSSFSPTFFWARPFMVQENTSLAASTTETLMRPTKSSTTMFEAQKTRYETNFILASRL